MKRTDLAYIAGIVDGEGSISISRYGGKRNSSYCRLTVTNTSEWLIRWLQFSLGGSVSVYKRKEESHKIAYNWYLNEHLTLDALKLILPYLRIKRPQAEIAIQFLEGRFRGKHRNKYTDSKIQIVEEAQRITMCNLNQRGVKRLHDES